ncbi:MAG: ribosomal protein S18-alanine N-acetyltransferase [Lachnospiraceae bacterium]|nr:ribosomal protein S18-alanine N-acetyltransferase [Lachnospiraceae bacterium]
MLRIRNMTTDDLEQVCQIENNSFSAPWSYKSFKESLANPNAFYVVACPEDNLQQIQGYCGVYLIGDEADINQVAVVKEHRRNGIGKQMLNELMHILEEKNIVAVTLEVRKSNVAAIALYESLGFVTEGVRKNFYEKPTEDALIMWKR